jgi:hypothetical protein
MTVVGAYFDCIEYRDVVVLAFVDWIQAVVPFFDGRRERETELFAVGAVGHNCGEEILRHGEWVRRGN